jgi:hypothetical protein
MISSAFARRLPCWLEQAPVLDLFIQGLGAFDSGALYVPDVVCIYRLRTASSFTNRMATTYVSRAWLSSYEATLKNFDRDTGGLYTDEIALQAAVVYCKGARSSVRLGNKNDFVERIVKSFQYYPNLNANQIVLYRLRRCFHALTWLHRLQGRIRYLTPH